jgi:hypothetical protein
MQLPAKEKNPAAAPVKYFKKQLLIIIYRNLNGFTRHFLTIKLLFLPLAANTPLRDFDFSVCLRQPSREPAKNQNFLLLPAGTIYAPSPLSRPRTPAYPSPPFNWYSVLFRGLNKGKGALLTRVFYAKTLTCKNRTSRRYL